MKRFVLLLSLAAFAGAASPQPPPPPAAPKPANSSSTASKSAAASGSGSAASTTVPPWIKLPPGIPHVVHAPVKVAVALRYEDIKVGTGPLGESGKLWHVQ